MASQHSHSHTEEPRTGIISGHKIQQATAATHNLENPEEASSVGLKHTKLVQPLTPWEPRTGIISWHETQQATVATHILESQAQALSVHLKHRKSLQPPTN